MITLKKTELFNLLMDVLIVYSCREGLSYSDAANAVLEKNRHLSDVFADLHYGDTFECLETGVVMIKVRPFDIPALGIEVNAISTEGSMKGFCVKKLQSYHKVKQVTGDGV